MYVLLDESPALSEQSNIMKMMVVVCLSLGSTCAEIGVAHVEKPSLVRDAADHRSGLTHIPDLCTCRETVVDEGCTTADYGLVLLICLICLQAVQLSLYESH